MAKATSDFQVDEKVFENDMKIREGYLRVSDEMMKLGLLLLSGHVYLLYDAAKNPPTGALFAWIVKPPSLWFLAIAAAGIACAACFIHRALLSHAMQVRSYYLKLLAKIEWRGNQSPKQPAESESKESLKERDKYKRLQSQAVLAFDVAAACLVLSIACAVGVVLWKAF